jgi:hypothetical protein
MIALISRLFIISVLILHTSTATTQSTDDHDIVPSAAASEQLESLSQLTLSESPVSLSQTGQCPTAPKPDCLDAYCLGPIHASLMQYQCAAATAFHSNGRDVMLTRCRCCPPTVRVWCPNYDCLAPPGTRQCTNVQLEGCTCETTQDRVERAHRQDPDNEYALDDLPDWDDVMVEVNDDGYFDAPSSTQTQSATTSYSHSCQTIQEQQRHKFGIMALPTLGVDRAMFRVMRIGQVGVLGSL